MASDGNYKNLLLQYGEEYFVHGGYHPYMDFPRHNDVFARFIGMMHPTSVLDVGCAYGFIVFRCLNQGIFAVGLDVSKWCGKRKIIPGYYVQGTGWALPFRDKSFDVIFCEGVLEHIPEDKIDLLMAEFDRVADRKFLGLSPDHPETLLHVCNHNIKWWYDKVPPGTVLGATGESLDIENMWYHKQAP